MKKLGDVRQVTGVPVAGDFANSTGTPLVIDAAGAVAPAHTLSRRPAL